MNHTDFAKEELTKAGLFDKDSDYEGMIGRATLELVEVFDKQGHSGFSASWVTGLFTKLVNLEPLTPPKNGTVATESQEGEMMR